MVRKTPRDDSENEAARPFSDTVRESAGQIWLAGLGAFAKAQEEGTRVFDALVKEGLSLQRKSQAGAEEKFSEASGRMAGMASGFSSRASGQWDKLETLFEERLSRAMKKLGVPSARDIEALEARVAALEAAQGARSGSSSPASARTADAETGTAGDGPVRRPTRRVE